MKAVIVEIKGRDAAILSDDGRISIIKNKNYTLGQEIILRNNKHIKFAASIAASLMLLATPAWAYLTPYSYVSLDINPSFEFSINRFDRVLNVKAVNDDGVEVVEKISIDKLKNKEIKEAVKNVLVGLKEQGYIIEGKEGGVVIATSSKSKDKTDELALTLKTAVEEEVGAKPNNPDNIGEKPNEKEKQVIKAEETEKEVKQELKTEVKVEKPVENVEVAESEDKEKTVKTKDVKVANEEKEDVKKQVKEDKKSKKNINIEIIEVSNEEVSEARAHNITPGKMNLVRKLEAKAGKNFDEATFNEWTNKSVQEIMEEIKKYDREEKSQKKESKQEEKDRKKEDKDNKKPFEQESDKKSKNKNKN